MAWIIRLVVLAIVIAMAIAASNTKQQQSKELTALPDFRPLFHSKEV